MTKPTKAQPNYWYSEDDISGLLNILKPDNVKVFAQTQFEHEDLLIDNFSNAITSVVETGQTCLMPIHLHGNHWAGAIIRMQDNGEIQVIYNDPMGESLDSQPNAIKLITAVERVVSGTTIIDLQLRQQRNGNDCGPFTVDNLINLASYGDLDGLERAEILKQKILQTPLDGSAIAIRNQHSGLLPHLELDHVIERSSESLAASKTYKSNSEFWSDVKKLLHLRKKISGFREIPSDEERRNILFDIGKIAESIYRKDIDKSAIRNLFSSNESQNILYLDMLELLTHIPETTNPKFLDDIATDLDLISSNIDHVIGDANIAKRIKELASSHDDGDEILKECGEITLSKAKQDHLVPENLRNFIASYYIPKALQRMREIIPQRLEFDWERRIDRYYFARVFAMLGELSRGVRYVISNEVAQQKFFRDLNYIRNNLKKKAHFKFFSDGNQFVHKGDDGSEVRFIDDIDKINQVVSSFSLIAQNIEILQKSFAEDLIGDLGAIERILNKPLKGLKILSEFAKILEGKNYVKNDQEEIEDWDENQKELKNLLDQIAITQENISKLEVSIKTDVDVPSYYPDLLDNFDRIDVEIKTRLLLPATVDELGGFEMSKISAKDRKFLCSYKFEDGTNYFARLGKIVKYFKWCSDLNELQEELKKLKGNYSEKFEEMDEEDRQGFPDLDDPEAVESYMDQKQQTEQKQKEEASKKGQKLPKKEERSEFAKHCQDFEKEAERLKSLFADSDLDDEETKKRREFAIAHSIGIIGESIRFMFEIDADKGFLDDLSTRVMSSDINETRIVRNRQVMHGVFNYNAEEVLRVATQNTVPWKRSVEAIARVNEFLDIVSRSDDYFDREAKKMNVSKEKLEVRMKMFIGDAYVSLGKFQESEELLNEAKKILSEQTSGESLTEEHLRINKLLSSIHNKKGELDEALDLIDESLALIISEADKYQNMLPSFLNDKATILCERGSYEKAKEFYRQAAEQKSIPAAINLSSLIYDEGNHDEAIKMLEGYFLELYPDRMQKPLEFLHLLREKWLMQSEDGQFAKADKSFHFYIKFYRDNIPLFKEVLGQGYRDIEALILRDEAGEFYQKGHYYKAINRWENALSILTEDDLLTPKDLAQINLNIGNAYKYLASRYSLDRSEVSVLREVALSYYDQITSDTKLDDSLLEKAHAYAASAEIYARLRKREPSRNCQQKAQNIFTQHGELGHAYRDNMNNALQSIQVDLNHRSRRESIVVNDDYASFQGGMTDMKSKMRSGDHQNAIDDIDNQLMEARRLGFVNPTVIQLMFEKFICHCSLGQQKQALEAYNELEKKVEKHPDCADHSYRENANKIFQNKFHSSLSSSRMPSSDSVKSAKADVMVKTSHHR